MMSSFPIFRFRAGSTGLAVLVGLFMASWTLSSTVDDAWISARYGASWAAGHGWVYSPDMPPVEGFTNLTWTALLGVSHALSIPPLWAMCGLGLFCHAACIVAADGLGRALAPGTPQWTLVIPAWAVALSPHLAVTATNGLETSLYLAVVLTCLWAAQGPRRPVLTAGLVGLASLTRPEAVLLAPVAVLLRDRDHRSWTVPFAGTTAATWGLVSLWRWSLYGGFVPNTFSAKAGVPVAVVLDQNWTYLAMDGPLWLLVFGILFAALLRRGSTRAVRWVAATGLVLAGLTLRVGLWMPGARLLCVGWVCAACVLPSLLWGGPSVVRWSRRAIGLGLVFLAGPGGTSVRDYDARHSVQPHNGAARAGQWLARHLPDGATLAVRDAGVLAYWVGPEINVAELHPRALTQPHPDGAPADLAAFLPAHPHAIVLTQSRRDAPGVRYPNDRRVFEQVKRPYRYVGRAYQHYHRYYDIYVRADVALPEATPAWVVNTLGPPPPTGRRRRRTPP